MRFKNAERIDKQGNKIISLIEENEKAVAELQKYAEAGKTLYTAMDSYIAADNKLVRPVTISFEDWEIRLMIHQKKQRINALKVQLENL